MYKIKKLKNGIDVITAPLNGTKTVTVLVVAATGSKFEKKETSGLSHFVEHLFFKGTLKRPTTLAISSALDQVGGEFNAFTGKEYTGYYVKVAERYLELALDVLSDILLNSKFDKEEVKRERGVVIEELNMYEDNPMAFIEELFESCLYGDSPAGWDTIGTKKNILSFDREKVLEYVGSQYSSDKMIISLAGYLKPETIKMTEKYFNGFKKRNYRDKIKTKDDQSGPRLKIHFKKTDQAHLSLGVRTYDFSHPDDLTAKAVAAILGGAMSSRLFTELRERRGLAYYVRSHDEAYSDTGYLTTQAGVPINKLNESIKVILSEYKKIAAEPVSEEELNRVKQGMIGRNTLRLEASDDVAEWYAKQIILFKERKQKVRLLTPEDFYGRLKKITIKDLSRVAGKIFVNKNLNLAVIGPYGKKEGEEIKKINRIF